MFHRIALIDDTGITEEGIGTLGRYSDEPVVVFRDHPTTEDEIIERIADADAILLSWRPNLTRRVIESRPGIRYIGMCCTLRDQAASNVDIAAAAERGIAVRGVRDHADQGAVEFILAQLTSLYMGLGCEPWLGEAGELAGKRLGIIGLGATGRLLADHALAFGMDVSYFSRRERRDLQLSPIQYKPMRRLLADSDIISLHVPRGALVLGPDEFALMTGRSIFVNTSLDPSFDHEAFAKWIEKDGHFAILDGCGADGLSKEILRRRNVAAIDRVSGWTMEARDRLTKSAIANLEEFLETR